MINISFLFVAFIMIIIWTGYRVIVHRRFDISLIREIALNIFFLYFLAMVSFTIFKNGHLMMNFDNYGYANLIPFKETLKMFTDDFGSTRRALYNVFGNILLFVPLGFFIPLFYEKYNSLLKVTFYGMLASITIEGIQYLTAMNITDIDDVIFNTLGALVGALCYRIFEAIFRGKRLEELMNTIKDNKKVNLFAVAFKPLSVMLLCSAAFVFYSMFTNSYSSKLNQEEFAAEVFSDSWKGGSFVKAKDFDRYRLFLRDNESYIDLAVFERIFIDRYVVEGNYQLNLQGNKYGYDVVFLQDIKNNSTGVAVFGKNKDAKTISINFQGEEYKEDLKAEDYFIVVYPKFQKAEDYWDIYNLYNGGTSKDLQIKFSDEKGQETGNMKLIR